MKKLYSILAATILFGAVTPTVRAAVQVSVDFFHDNLESYGDWREVGDYGYCWQPRDVDRNWRPYSDGHWLYTDAGWTWDSEEPYSWAVYHYGRWARVDQVGWVWVPGTEWGPAWVSWRRSPQHVGWAPLPPEAQFTRSAGFSARVDVDFDIGPANYSFVEVRNFGAPRLLTVFVEPRENITIINQTTNITRITYVNNVVYNEGPQYDVISRESAQPIRRLKLERRETLDGDPAAVRAEQLKPKVEGDSLRVVALPFDTKPATAPRKIAPRVEKAEVNHGWENAGPPAEVEKLRTKIKSEPAKPVELSPQPAKEKTPAAPALVPVPAPVPDEKPAPPIKPVKGTKAVNPEAKHLPASPPVDGTLEQPPVRKGKNKGMETPRPPAEIPPQAPVPMRKKEKSEPSGNPSPDAVETPRQKNHPRNGETQPKPEQPASEPRPQAQRPELRQPTAPTHTQPQPPQPAKEKGKGKDKEEKKDAAKPEGAPQ